MVLVVIVFVFSHLTVTQVKAEGIQCPSVCQCPNKTVAICKDLQIDGINVYKDKFETSLEKLDFSGNKLSSLGDDTFTEWNIYSLHCFNLSGNNIVNITKYVFQGFDNLVALDLSRNSIFSIISETFELSPILAFLRLASNRLTEIHPDTFSTLKHLGHLDLSNNNVSTVHPETFLNNGDLEWLGLANNRLTAIHPHIFQNQRNLSYLDLSGNIITKIEGAVFYYNRKLETLLLASNNISEFIGASFNERNELSYLDVSRNRIEKLESLKFRTLKVLNISKNSLQSLRSRSFSNLTELQSLSLAGNSIVEINDEAFYGLKKLEYLDLSSNNITYISASVFQNMLPELNASEGTYVFRINVSNLSNKAIHYFNFEVYDPFNLTSIILCKMELLKLRENCLSIFDENSLNMFNTSGALINVTNNPCSYECSSQDVYKIINVTSLNCVSQGDLRVEKCNISEHNDCSTTVQSVSATSDDDVNKTDMDFSASFDDNVNKTDMDFKKEVDDKIFVENMKEPEPSLPANVVIFGIYALSVFVEIVVVLVITRIVGKPEPDEFWWEDKLAKRNY